MEYIIFLAALSLFCSLIIIKSANKTFKPRIAAREASYDPSLVTIPVDTIASTSVDECTSLCTRYVEKNEVCAVCLDYLDPRLNSSSDNHENSTSVDREVRELVHNCHHLFHRGCLDAWITRGHATCPVCRAMLTVAAEEKARKFRPATGRDPRRLERMSYLFGGDVMF